MHFERKRSDRTVLCIVAAILVGFVGLYIAGRIVFKGTVTYSYLRAASDILFHADPCEIESRMGTIDDKWVLFNEAAYNYTARILHESGMVDRGNLSDDLEDILNDSWHKRILIAVRREDQDLVYALWSKGPDGISGNDDDILAFSTDKDVVLQLSADPESSNN